MNNNYQLIDNPFDPNNNILTEDNLSFVINIPVCKQCEKPSLFCFKRKKKYHSQIEKNWVKLKCNNCSNCCFNGFYCNNIDNKGYEHGIYFSENFPILVNKQGKLYCTKCYFSKKIHLEKQ